MTLVLSLLTGHEVIQVSDRRFTFLKGQKVVGCDDDKNKAVVWCGATAFAFTGVGDIGPDRRTDLWLAGIIATGEEKARQAQEAGGSSSGQDALLIYIANRCTEQFRKLRYRGERHAFVAVGWTRFASNPENLVPFWATVSNFHDEQGNEINQAAPSFRAIVRPLTENEGGWLSDVGQRLDPAQRAKLVAALAQADESRNVDEIVRLLTAQIRAIAGANEFVGSDVMVTVVPREAVEHGASGGIMASGPEAGIPTFLYIPRDGNTTVQYGPVHVCRGVQTADFVAGPIDAIPPEILNSRSTRPR